MQRCCLLAFFETGAVCGGGRAAARLHSWAPQLSRSYSCYGAQNVCQERGRPPLACHLSLFRLPSSHVTQAGMERKDVMSKNVAIYKAQAAALEKGAAPGCKVRWRL